MWKWQSTKGGDTSRPPASIDAPGLGRDVRLDRDDLAAGAGDVDAGAAVGKGGVLYEEADGHGWILGDRTGQTWTEGCRNAYLCHMGTHTVAEARDRLPELIERAREGEAVVITQDGTPVAEITPLRKQARKSRRLTQADIDWLDDASSPTRQADDDRFGHAHPQRCVTNPIHERLSRRQFPGTALCR